MTWIRTVDPTEAEGLLRRLYETAVRRAGKIFNVIRCQSLRPPVLKASTDLYLEVMHGRQSPLSRARREMIATVVSRVNACRYWTDEHAKDLRAEVHDRPDGGALVAALKADYRQAELDPPDRAMLDFAVKLTLTPAAMEEDDVASLRRAGFDDTAIHDIVQVTALFNYYNRLADGLGIPPEDGGLVPLSS